MDCYKKIFKNVILMMFGLLLVIGTAIPVEAQWYLTQEEKDYIAKGSVIKAGSIDGVAPLHYMDEKGEVKGIGKQVLEEISHMTGLVFEYKLYDSVTEVLESDSNIVFGISEKYAPEGMVLSQTYLNSNAILYINSSLDSNNLKDKIYAALKGGTLPDGIKEENTIFYNSREESLDAVEKGRADYGYGNAYSVAFYTLQNGYKNIVAIPIEKEPREYCMGFLKEDGILLSIINKSIDQIDENKMQMLILDATSDINRKITFSMIMDTYGKEIFGIVSIAMAILTFSVIVNIRGNRQLRLQNKKYEVLSSLSNEYLYEYDVKQNYLELSEGFIQLFKEPKDSYELANILKNTLFNKDLNDDTFNIKLTLGNGSIGVFKGINSGIYDDSGKLHTIIGKLIDISEEAAEKEELIVKSQRDGLTGLYNAITTKEHIIRRIEGKEKQEIDALILIDCDKFKEVNDTFGHLVGNQVLEHIGNNLKSFFRSSDIVGRLGGDEFCVYLKNITSIEFAKNKCKELKILMQENDDFKCVRFSIGIAQVREERDYEDIFKKADDCLYEAKKKGGAQIIVYDEG